jgi:hypothetical protein
MANPESAEAVSPFTVALAGALALAVAMGIGRFAFTPLLPLMIQGGQLDVAAGGWMAAANYAGYLAGAMSAARLPLSAPRLGIAALLLTAALTAAMALPGPTALWLALRFAAGVSSAWAFVSTGVWCLGALARMRKPSWGGGVYAGVGAGIALAGLYCLFGAWGGLSAPALWLQLGALALVLMLPACVVLRRLHVQETARAVPAARPAPDAPGTTAIILCYGLLGFGYILPATFLPVLARSLVDDPRLFGLAWPVFGLTAALSTFVAGWAMRHATRLQVWAVSNVIMGAGALLPALWLNGWTVALSALCVGGTFMVVTLAGVQEIRARAGGDPTRLVSRLVAAFAIGQIAGPVASTLLLHLPAVGERGLALALQAAALALFASAVWLWHQTPPSVQPETLHAP